jgi:2-methylcitrate dehydratase
VSTLLRRAIEDKNLYEGLNNMNDIWKKLFLTPSDYGLEGLNDPNTRKLMNCIEFEHGGEKYDSKYPDGIPTSVVITTKGKYSFFALFSY